MIILEFDKLCINLLVYLFEKLYKFSNSIILQIVTYIAKNSKIPNINNIYLYLYSPRHLVYGYKHTETTVKYDITPKKYFLSNS